MHQNILALSASANQPYPLTLSPFDRRASLRLAPRRLPIARAPELAAS